MIAKNREDISDVRRLRELIIHIADRCHLDSTFDTVKLMKLLFYSDFSYFAAHGESITRQRYANSGHLATPLGLSVAKEKLLKENSIVVRRPPYSFFPKTRVIALRSADLTIFNGQEIAFVETIVQFFWESKMEDKQLPRWFNLWSLAEKGETIPYGIAFLSDRKPTREEYEFARSLVDVR